MKQESRSRLRSACHILTALLLMLAVCPGLVAAQSEVHLHDHQHAATAEPALAETAVGVDEKLGSHIPLDITFRDENGQPVRLAELISGPTIILPVYYSCTNVCNFLQSGLARVLPSIKRIPGKDYTVLSISFDETETPEQATRFKRMYLTAINAPFPEQGWRFLTGDAANIRRLTDAAGYHFQRRGRDFIHPVASFVLAGDGMIVRYLYGTTFLPKDLTLALVEAREGQVGTTIRKLVDFCFTFDKNNKTYVFNLLRVSATVVILCTSGFLAFLLLTGKKRRKRDSEDS